MEITKCAEDNCRQEDNPHLYVRKQCFAYVKKTKRTPRTGRSWQAADENKMSRGQTDSWFVATSDFCSKVGKQFELFYQFIRSSITYYFMNINLFSSSTIMQ